MSSIDLGIEKIRRIFHDVEDIGEPVACPVRIEDKIWSPPSYIVRLVLSMCGLKIWGPDEKVTWTAFLRYKEVGFEVRDWKRTTWTIEVDSADKQAFDAAHELKRKIIGAAKILDDHLAAAFREEVKAGRFFIDNTYLKVRNTYEHFKVEYVRNEALPQSGVSLGEQLTAAAESVSRRGYNGCAAVAFYFSAVEVLLDVFYAFGNKDVDYETFQKGSEWDWKKRFKHVLPVSTCGELASIYERLLRIKRNIRDRVLHGMGGEESLLVSVPRLGLLPISYKHLDPMDGLGWFPLSNEAFSDVPAAFDEFDTWLSESQPWANQVLYAESMLAIPLFGRRRDEILQAMSEPDFEDWIHSEQEYLDYLLNDWSWG